MGRTREHACRVDATLGDTKGGKLASKCETAIKRAGAKLVNGEVKLVRKCGNAVVVCLGKCRHCRAENQAPRLRELLGIGQLQLP